MVELSPLADGLVEDDVEKVVMMRLSKAAAELWPHQMEAVELACKQLAEGGRATQVLACGCGKTRIGAHAAAGLVHRGRRLVLAPTVTLLGQLLREYRATIGDAALGRVLAVCAERIAGAGQSGLDDLEAQQAVLTTTDPAAISRAVCGPGPVTVFSTYHSVAALSRAHRDYGLPAWHIVVLDEAHRTVGGEAWSRVHDDEHLPAERRLYMTATPRQITTRGVDTDLIGMDDESVFGPTIYRLGYSTAIELGLLARYRMVVSVVTDAEVRALTDETDRRTEMRVGAARLPARMLAAQIALLRAAADYGVTRAISYHSGVAEARQFSATLPAVARRLPAGTGPTGVWAEHLRAEHTAELRHQRLQRLAAGVDDGLAVISNARLLSEGVDVPAVDAIMFSDPRHSTVDIIQAIGRAVRRGGRPDKVATIIVPLLAEPGVDATTALTGSAYAPVWRVVRALRSHDDGLAAELDRWRRAGAAVHGSGARPGRLRWLHVDGCELSEQFVDAITVGVIESATAVWEEFYGAAADYREQYGDLLVPQAWVTDTGLALGVWLNSQRQLYGRRKLRPERIRQLEAIGMIWAPLEAAWERGFAAAAAYREQHGHLDVPLPHVAPDGFKLGQWIFTQRSTYRQDNLDPDRRHRLESLGIRWHVAEAQRDAAWERGVSAAAAYREQHGHLAVPRGYVDRDGFKLGAWLSRIKGRQDSLTPERRAALTALGMRWEDHRDIAWERGYVAAATYHRQHGHLNVPHDYTTSDGFGLGTWIRNQRRRCDDPAKRQHLDDLGMIWSAREADWQNALAIATAYARRHGHLHPPVSYVTDDGFRLGDWLANRRNSGHLTPQRRAQLNALDPTWADQRSPGRQS